jgi:hypothetical protein
MKIEDDLLQTNRAYTLKPMGVYAQEGLVSMILSDAQTAQRGTQQKRPASLWREIGRFPAQ